MKLLIAREQKMPAALADARKNLDNPPRIYTEIAIEQIDGNIGFFKTAVPGGLRRREGCRAHGRVQEGERRRDRRAQRVTRTG